MKLISKILILTLIYLICGARGCNDEGSLKEKNEIKLFAAKDSIKQAFGIEIPSEQLLRAYETTAQQKVTDFADYIKIASDSSLASNFRKQAAEMARKLFIPGNIDIRRWNQVNSKFEIRTLEQLLDKSLLHGMPCWIRPLEITIKIPFTRMNDSTFTGRLVFKQQYIAFKNSDVQGNNSGMLTIDMYACKKIKSFGQENLQVWEVYLGDIN
jgi:hypothetical protein